MCKHCRFRAAGPEKWKEDMAYLQTLLEYKKAGYPFGRDPLKLDRALSLWTAFTQQTTSRRIGYQVAASGRFTWQLVGCFRHACHRILSYITTGVRAIAALLVRR